MTIDSWIERTASKSPDKTAIIFDGLQLSYGQMMNAVNSYISLLNARGIGKGDRLAYLGLNDPVIFILLFACAKIGAIFVPVNWRLSETEIGEILENCQPELLIYDKGFSELAEKFKSCPSALKCALEQELGKSTQQPVFDAANICLEDPLLLVYTSGSTGRPKGVILSQRAVCANAEMSIEAHKICAEDTVLCVLPLFHVGGMNILATPAFYMGATVILQAVFDPQTCLAACQRAQLIITVPTILKRMTEHENWEQTNLDQMRVISIGSTDVPVELIEAVHKRAVPVIQIYGATETAPMAIYQHIDEAFDTVGSIGRKGCACDIEIRDADGAKARTGQPGEICVRGPNILSGYWRDEALSHEAIKQGWFYTGDVARQDADGLYWFVDRIKHVIISGGENIYPAEIERVLRSHPDIEEVAVVGKPDTEWGEVPVAVIGQSPEANSQDIRNFLNGKLARFKHPREICFVDFLPRNAMGKIVASDVKALLCEKPAP